MSITLILVSCGKPSNSDNVENTSPETIAPVLDSLSPSIEPSTKPSPQKTVTSETPEASSKQTIDPGRPEFNLASGVSKGGVIVSLSCTVEEAQIVYTLDGSDPKPGTSKVYSAPLKITTSTIVKARSYIPDGGSSALVSNDYTIGEICVANGGSGDGSRSRPLGSLKAALAMVAASGISTIKLTSGSYQAILELQAAVTISGGWNSSFTKNSGTRSIVSGTDMAGKSATAPAYAVKISNSDVKLENLDIRSAEAEFTAGLFITQNATPNLYNCILTAGSGSYGYGAIITQGANPTFTLCRLDGGPNPTSTGIYLDSASATLLSCISAAGSGTITGYGANLIGGQITAYSSVFAGNTANSSYGIKMANSKGSVLESCTIWGGSGNQSQALFITIGNPTVSSCIIAANGKQKSYGIYDNYGASAPAVLKNSAFTGCETGLYFDADTNTAFTSLIDGSKFTNSAGKTLSAATAVACQSLLFNVGASPNCKTPADAPSSVLSGGLASTNWNQDVAGKERTTPWAIGAWEIEP